MDRAWKIKILHQFLTGETTLLRKIKPIPQPERVFTNDELSAMTDNQLTAFLISEGRIDSKELTACQITALLESGKNQACYEYDSMSDEKLDEIINRGSHEIQ